MQPVSTRVRPRVSPGADGAPVGGRHREAWKVGVAALREGGHPSEAVVRRLAETRSLPRAAVTLVSGQGARDKIVQPAGLDQSQIDRRLSSAAEKERPG